MTDYPGTETVGLRPRAVHAAGVGGVADFAGVTLCGLGGTPLIADNPGDVTCKSCVKVQGSLESHRQIVTRAQDARWAALRANLTQDAAADQELGDDYAEMGTDEALDTAHHHWGRAKVLREVLAWMDREDGS